MRTLTAQWSSKCHGCAKPLLKGTEARYNDETRQIFHLECEPEEQRDLLGAGDAEQLADKLGFSKSGDLL